MGDKRTLFRYQAYVEGFPAHFDEKDFQIFLKNFSLKVLNAHLLPQKNYWWKRSAFVAFQTRKALDAFVVTCDGEVISNQSLAARYSDSTQHFDMEEEKMEKTQKVIVKEKSLSSQMGSLHVDLSPKLFPKLAPPPQPKIIEASEKVPSLPSPPPPPPPVQTQDKTYILHAQVEGIDEFGRLRRKVVLRIDPGTSVETLMSLMGPFASAVLDLTIQAKMNCNEVVAYIDTYDEQDCSKIVAYLKARNVVVA